MNSAPPDHKLFAFSYVLGVILLIAVMFDLTTPIASPHYVSVSPPSFLALGGDLTLPVRYSYRGPMGIFNGNQTIRYRFRSGGIIEIIFPWPLSNISIGPGNSRDFPVLDGRGFIVGSITVGYSTNGRIIIIFDPDLTNGIRLPGARSNIVLLDVLASDIRSVIGFGVNYDYASVLVDTVHGVHLGVLFPDPLHGNRLTGGEFHEVLDASGKVQDVVIKGFGVGTVSAKSNPDKFCNILCTALDQAKANGDSAATAQLTKWQSDNGTGKACNCTGGKYKSPTGGVPPTGRVPAPTPPATNVPSSPRVGPPNEF